MYNAKVNACQCKTAPTFLRKSCSVSCHIRFSLRTPSCEHNLPAPDFLFPVFRRKPVFVFRCFPITLSMFDLVIWKYLLDLSLQNNWSKSSQQLINRVMHISFWAFFPPPVDVSGYHDDGQDNVENNVSCWSKVNRRALVGNVLWNLRQYHLNYFSNCTLGNCCYILPQRHKITKKLWLYIAGCVET